MNPINKPFLPKTQPDVEAVKRQQTQDFREAMIGHKRIPTQEGGVEIVVRELATHMVKLGNHVDAYNRWDIFTKGGRVGGKTYHGVRIRQIPTLHNSKLNAFIYSILASVRALFGNYDLIHYHAIGSCAMIWISKLFHKKVIVTVHGLDWQRAKWNKFATFYLKYGERMAVKYADEIIVLSKGNQKYFLETYGRRTHLIPNGMATHTPVAADIITAKYGLGRGDYALYLARIVPEKGVHYLLDAFLQVKTNKRLVIAGGIDWDDEYCRKISEMAARDDRVTLAGLVQGREWEELFSNNMLYVLPSDIEGMPMSLLEAISFGCRCLVSDIPENVDAGKGCVNTFQHSNVDDLRDKLQFLIDHPDQGQNPGDAQWEDWDTVTQKTLDLYHEVMSPDYKPTHREEVEAWRKARKENQKQ